MHAPNTTGTTPWAPKAQNRHRHGPSFCCRMISHGAITRSAVTHWAFKPARRVSFGGGVENDQGERERKRFQPSDKEREGEAGPPPGFSIVLCTTAVKLATARSVADRGLAQLPYLLGEGNIGDRISDWCKLR